MSVDTMAAEEDGRREMRALQACQHPIACIVSSGPPEWRSHYCGACEREGQAVAKAIEAEREACAKAAEQIAVRYEQCSCGWEAEGAERCAAAIRARGAT